MSIRKIASVVSIVPEVLLEAKVIEKHTLESTEGLTYAELDREDPACPTRKNALRS